MLRKTLLAAVLAICYAIVVTSAHAIQKSRNEDVSEVRAAMAVSANPHGTRDPSTTTAFQKYSYLSFPARQTWTAPDFALYAMEVGALEGLKHIVQEEGKEVLTEGCFGGPEDMCMPATAAALHPHILEYVAEIAPEALETPDRYGYTPAFYAPNVEALRYLVRHAPGKENILDAATGQGMTLAHHFINQHMLSALQYVVENAPNARSVLQRRTRAGTTPTSWAISYGLKPDIEYVVSIVGPAVLEAERATIAICSDFLILEYFSTLPNRDILLGAIPLVAPAGQAVLSAYEAAEEELCMVQEAINTLYLAAMDLTAAQQEAFEGGEEVSLTATQNARFLALRRYAPFAALAESVLEQTTQLFKKYEKPLPGFTAHAKWWAQQKGELSVLEPDSLAYPGMDAAAQ